jgi:hypothetical protein
MEELLNVLLLFAAFNGNQEVWMDSSCHYHYQEWSLKCCPMYAGVSECILMSPTHHCTRQDTRQNIRDMYDAIREHRLIVCTNAWMRDRNLGRVVDDNDGFNEEYNEHMP